MYCVERFGQLVDRALYRMVLLSYGRPLTKMPVKVLALAGGIPGIHVTRALSLRTSRKKKDETIESPNLASHLGTRMCSFSSVTLGASDLSASKRNVTRMHALCAFRRNVIFYVAQVATGRREH